VVPKSIPIAAGVGEFCKCRISPLFRSVPIGAIAYVLNVLGALAL